MINLQVFVSGDQMMQSFYLLILLPDVHLHYEKPERFQNHVILVKT